MSRLYPMDVIFTDDRGVPFERPERADFEDDTDYQRAVSSYRNRVGAESLRGFSDAFNASLKEEER